MKGKFNFNLSKGKINRLNDYKRKIVYWGGKETLLGMTSREKNILILSNERETIRKHEHTQEICCATCKYIDSDNYPCNKCDEGLSNWEQI